MQEMDLWWRVDYVGEDVARAVCIVELPITYRRRTSRSRSKVSRVRSPAALKAGLCDGSRLLRLYMGGEKWCHAETAW